MDRGTVRHLQVETTNICNAHCVFCPHDRFRSFGTMADELYERILRDASQYEIETFAPMLTGEPFCDPQMVDRIRLARQMMPDTLIRIFTNGSLVAYEDIGALAEMGKIEIYVSLNGASRSIRRKLMGLDDYDEVVRKLRYMVEKGLNPTPTMVWFPTLTAFDINAFAQFAKALPIRFQSFAGQIYRYKRTVATQCQRVTDYLTVLYTGRVNLCCFDPFGKVVFGDLKHQTIEEVRESPLHQEYLKAHQEGRGQEMALCQSCTEGA